MVIEAGKLHFRVIQQTKLGPLFMVAAGKHKSAVNAQSMAFANEWICTGLSMCQCSCYMHIIGVDSKGCHIHALSLIRWMHRTAPHRYVMQDVAGSIINSLRAAASAPHTCIGCDSTHVIWHWRLLTNLPNVNMPHIMEKKCTWIGCVYDWLNSITSLNV